MGIVEFIREQVLIPRLKKSQCMVVYDAERRYRELCLGLACDAIQVIDASESSIESREAALRGLARAGHGQRSVEGLLIYVPARKPLSEQQKQADPFALYAECGARVPGG